MRSLDAALIEREKSAYFRRRSWRCASIIALVILLVVTALASLTVGAARISAVMAARTVFGLGLPVEAEETLRQVLFSIRLPRALAAICAGMSLSCAGLVMQGVFQNPLVSPYTLGVSNGAAFGASLAIIFRARFLSAPPLIGDYLLPASAFVFSLLTMFLVYAIARVRAESGRTLLLAGVAIGYLFSALVAAIRYFSNMRELPELVFWTMGGLSAVPKSGVLIIALINVLSISVMLLKAWDINALAAGPDQAVSLGVNYERLRVTLFILSTLMTAAAVSFTGVIGFVGLIAPHITRFIAGSDYRWAIPAAALTGALLLLASDTIARTLIAPSELPVGILTSFIGVPFFLYLILRRKH
ncbi:MAG: iron ABC transporter permease [Treponema sp.]|jgi:iron complex transport system permease protein|nr:iron ABC transporter permease [Treponema sp.]